MILTPGSRIPKSGDDGLFSASQILNYEEFTDSASRASRLGKAFFKRSKF